MNFSIEILAVTPTTKPTAKGSYTQLDGKTEGKKIMSFGAGANAFKALKDAKLGQVFSIDAQKNETTGYWDWVSASLGNSTSSGASTPVASPKSNYETSEERAKKQVYIIRQSSISSAVSLLKSDKKVPTVDEVLTVATAFTDFVLGNTSTPVESIDLNEDDDVPM
jgi:hypothetical protein